MYHPRTPVEAAGVGNTSTPINPSGCTWNSGACPIVLHGRQSSSTEGRSNVLEKFGAQTSMRERRDKSASRPADGVAPVKNANIDRQDQGVQFDCPKRSLTYGPAMGSPWGAKNTSRRPAYTPAARQRRAPRSAIPARYSWNNEMGGGPPPSSFRSRRARRCCKACRRAAVP